MFNALHSVPLSLPSAAPHAHRGAPSPASRCAASGSACETQGRPGHPPCPWPPAAWGGQRVSKVFAIAKRCACLHQGALGLPQYLPKRCAHGCHQRRSRAQRSNSTTPASHEANCVKSAQKHFPPTLSHASSRSWSSFTRLVAAARAASLASFLLYACCASRCGHTRQHRWRRSSQYPTGQSPCLRHRSTPRV